MANFATHIGVGTLVSGVLATVTLAADVILPEDLVAVTLAGVLGSVLPDIDLKDSRPSRAMFSGLAVFFSFCVLFNFATRFSIVEMWLLMAGTFLTVRYAGEALFHRLSYHRGIFHSILAGLTFWFLTAIVFRYVLGRHEGVAWLAGGFVFIGFLTHLVLDELYSVDVFDRRLKASFGTALKFFDAKHLGQSAAMAAACAVAFALTPPPAPFVQGISAPSLWSNLRKRMLPDEGWFGIESLRQFAMPAGVVGSGMSSPITTGTLPPATSEAATSVPTAAGPAGDLNAVEEKQ